MIEQTVNVTTRVGQMETFVCRPERGGPVPAVFLLMDAPGIREELFDMGRRLATVGYAVHVPDLYYRAGPANRYGPDVLTEGSPDHVAMRAIRTTMTIPPVMEDIADLLTYVDGHPYILPGPVGVHGYCMSGPYALAAAARFPDRVAAAASIYGTWLVSDAEESPHLSFDQMAGEVYIACAEHDDLAPPEMVGELRQRFDLSEVSGDLEIYPDVHHGFSFPSRWCYDRQAAERQWERLISLYRRRLG